MVTNDGVLKYLEAVRQAILDPALVGGATFKAVLFKDDFTPLRSLDWAAMSAIEADFAGYIRASLVAKFLTAPSLVADVPKLQGTSCLFTKTTGTADQTIYGHGVVLVDGGGVVLKLLSARKLLAPVTLTDAALSTSVVPYVLGLGI